jgi:hypothetical protein
MYGCEEEQAIRLLEKEEVNILGFSSSFPYRGPRIILDTLLSKIFNCFLSLFIRVEVSDAYINVLSIILF